jgi:putative ABC transport system substrate-binding protein
MNKIRRRLLALLSAFVGVPCSRAQQPSIRHVGLLWLGSAETSNLQTELKEGLRDKGFVEGANLAFDDRTSLSRYEHLEDVAKRLVATRPDVIVTYGATATRAVRAATSTTPIVMITGGDPVQLGFVQSLARPGGNVTGLTMMGDEVTSKRIELLKEALPRIRKLAIMFNPASPAEANSLRIAKDSAAALGLQAYASEVRAPEDLEEAFPGISRANADALLVVGSTMLFAHRRRISELAKMHRLPLISNTSEYVQAGALLAYGPDVGNVFRQASTHIARILNGASPADLPFEQSTKLRLAVNLQTARALDVAIPQSILLRADEVLRD